MNVRLYFCCNPTNLFNISISWGWWLCTIITLSVFFSLPLKPEDTYISTFQLVIYVAEEMKHEKDLEVTCTDYEKAAISVMSNLFLDSPGQRCFFHLVQIFYKRIQSNALASQYSSNKDVYVFQEKSTRIPSTKLRRIR